MRSLGTWVKFCDKNDEPKPAAKILHHRCMIAMSGMGMHCDCRPGSRMFARSVWLLMRMLTGVSVIHVVLVFRRREIGCPRGCHTELFRSDYLIDAGAGGIEPQAGVSQSCQRCTASSGAKPCSTNRSLPPGRRTRRISTSAAATCEIEHRVQVVTMVSTLCLSSGMASAEASRQRTGAHRKIAKPRQDDVVIEAHRALLKVTPAAV